jgi:hypothetical protein
MHASFWLENRTVYPWINFDIPLAVRESIKRFSVKLFLLNKVMPPVSLLFSVQTVSSLRVDVVPCTRHSLQSWSCAQCAFTHRECVWEDNVGKARYSIGEGGVLERVLLLLHSDDRGTHRVFVVVPREIRHKDALHRSSLTFIVDVCF